MKKTQPMHSDRNPRSTSQPSKGGAGKASGQQNLGQSQKQDKSTIKIDDNQKQSSMRHSLRSAKKSKNQNQKIEPMAEVTNNDYEFLEDSDD